jgi:hypothetical protein
MFDPLDSELAGEGNDQESVAGASDGNPYHEVWRTQAKWNSGRWRWICQKKERDRQWCLRMGVYGTGETTVGYWQDKKSADVQIMCSGGNADWAMESARSNTRAEQTHILAAMIQLFPVGPCFVCS